MACVPVTRFPSSSDKVQFRALYPSLTDCSYRQALICKIACKTVQNQFRSFQCPQSLSFLLVSFGFLLNCWPSFLLLYRLVSFPHLHIVTFVICRHCGFLLHLDRLYQTQVFLGFGFPLEECLQLRLLYLLSQPRLILFQMSTNTLIH